MTVLSVVFHLTFFLAAFLVVKQSSRFMMPSPYVVNLVGPDLRTEGRGDAQEVAQAPSEPQSRPVATEKKAAKNVEHPKAVSKAEETRVSERIAALKAKRDVERIAMLRNVISLKGSGPSGRPGPSPKTTAKGGSPAAEDYNSKITNDIQKHWALPDVSNKNIEAIIVIKILKDGSLLVSRIEKSSGSGLFDRSALRAIYKASPVTPPPYEMEIEVRFHP
ncbi:MAG TPA: TonB family protein [Thermodesulfovibrionales bacterium]|nr:TonB family protein [Thermodesulfovibrionales bacterium]